MNSMWQRRVELESGSGADGSSPGSSMTSSAAMAPIGSTAGSLSASPLPRAASAILPQRQAGTSMRMEELRRAQADRRRKVADAAAALAQREEQLTRQRKAREDA